MHYHFFIISKAPRVSLYTPLLLMSILTWTFLRAETQPEIPSIMRDVTNISASLSNTQYQFQKPYIPALRTSADGRIGLSLKFVNNRVAFYLYAPEKITNPFPLSPLGPSILSSTTPLTLLPDRFHDSNSSGNFQHVTLCDATPEFPMSGAATTPSSCGINGTSDCYDVTVVGGFQFTTNGIKNVELWGTPTRIQIDNPKTPQAKIVLVTTGTSVRGSTFRVTEFLEPMVTGDGKLLVARIGSSPLTWTNTANGTQSSGTYNIVYSVAPTNVTPCDVREWKSLYPISHAPYHAEVKSRYGFAQYPFRDPEGTVFPNGVEMRTTYPWIDRKGNNLFFTTLGPTLFYFNSSLGRVATRYPARCLPGLSCTSPTTSAQIKDYDEPSGTRGYSVMGLWTHGKMVLIDNTVNNTDYGLGMSNNEHRMLALYRAGTDSTGSSSGEVRVGTGREVNGTANPPGFVLNTTFIDSSENLFNYNQHLKPISYRDVVWRMNSGSVSSELVFDDYLNPNAFIVSEMSGSLSFPSGGGKTYNDGFSGQAFTREVRLQNAATAPSNRWIIPRYGRVIGSRIEPIALGGIHGKGLWLDPSSRVEYTVPAQPRNIAGSHWFIGLFLDSRFSNDGAARELMTFPDGSGVEIVGLSELRLRSPTGTSFTVPLSATLQLPYRGWIHLGFTVRDSGARVDIHINGSRFYSWLSPNTVRLFQFVPGTFILGSRATTNRGVTGWVDDLKVLSDIPSEEVLCNHARGTLVGLNQAYTGPLRSLALELPSAYHQAISTQLQAYGNPSFSHYACYRNWTENETTYPSSIPTATVSIREFLLFPEGPLIYNVRRPDSSQNSFCITCHGADLFRGLKPEALTGLNVEMQNDSRRQPMQPLRLLFGNIPVGFFGVSGPTTPMIAPPSGIAVDPYVAPNP